MSTVFDDLVAKMGQRKPTSQAEAKCREDKREAEYQARQEHERRHTAALVKLKS